MPKPYSPFKSAPSPDAFRDATLAAAGLQPVRVRSGDDFHRLREMTPTRRCAEMLRWLNDDTTVHGSDDSTILARALMAGGAVSDIFTQIFDAAVVQGTAEAVDTTLPWTVSVPVENFQWRPAFTLGPSGRLKLLPKGKTAESGEMVVAGHDWRLHRYARAITIDETSFSDDSAGVLPQIISKISAQAAMMRPDLVYSLILENPNIVDWTQTSDTPLFDSSHGNYATSGSALADTTLQAGMTAIGNQCHFDANGRPLHISQRPKYLVVPHELTYKARALARLISLNDDDDLEVVPESRLGPVSLFDPLTDVKRTGSTTCWMLAARPDILPSIVVGYLGGVETARVRKGPLSEGQWGVGIDINLDIGVVAVDYRQLYFATGEA